MTTDLSILIGLHDPDILEWSKISAAAAGFSVYSALTLEEMKALMGEKQYCGYLMDLNLGHRGAEDISPAIEVYALVRERVEHREAVFLGVSGRDAAVEAALEKNIPAESKPFHMFPFLHRCQELKTK